MSKVAYFKHKPSGCAWYRIQHPMEALQKHGVETQMVGLNVDIEIDDIEYFQVYGIYPFSFDHALRTLKDMGKKIVYDLDDALDLVEPTNPFYHSVMRDAGSQREIFKYADHITVATPALADYARTKTTAPITVIPNCYDAQEWTYPRPKRDGIRIGFAGSTTHIEDLLLVLPAIANLQKKYNEVKFLIMGFSDQDYPTWLKQTKYAATPEGLKAIEQFETYMKDIEFEWVPFVDFLQFPSTLINLSLDIGLCPVTNSAFNRARSASKAMEYTLAGALAVASNIETYKADYTSILVNDDEWEFALEDLINNPELIKYDHQLHLEWLQQNRNIDSPHNIDILKGVYLTSNT